MLPTSGRPPPNTMPSPPGALGCFPEWQLSSPEAHALAAEPAWEEPMANTQLLSTALGMYLGGEDVALGPVYADGDLGAGGAEFLEEAAISTDPQVVFGYLHLQ